MNDLWHDLVDPTIAAAIGTAAGASLAFWVERHKRKLTQEDEQVTATNTAIFALIQIWNDLENYRRDHIEAQRSNSERWITLRPTNLPVPPMLNAAILAFFFELPGEAPNLPARVHIEIERYRSIFDVATTRSRVHSEEAQPALEKSVSVPGAGGFRERLVTVFGGTRVVTTLEILTDDLINMVDSSLKSIPPTVNDLRDAAKKLFPKRQIIRFQPI